MTEHDRVRMVRALNYLQSREALLEVIGGLQSTDAPELVPLHDALWTVLRAVDELMDARRSVAATMDKLMGLEFAELESTTTSSTGSPTTSTPSAAWAARHMTIPAKYFTTHDATKAPPEAEAEAADAAEADEMIQRPGPTGG